ASGGEPPKPMTDGKDDKFATPGEAAKRLFEIRKLESETAAKARVDAVRNLAHDATIGRPSADIAADFKASMPAWVQEQKDLDLYKATLRQQGHLEAVAAIEKYEENFRWAEHHHKRAAEEQAKQVQAQPDPTPPPQPQPQPQQPLPPNVQQLQAAELQAHQLLNNAAAQFNAKYANLNLVTDPKV